MKRDNLANSHLGNYCWSFISKARVVLLPDGGAKRIPSILLMLLFTVFAFVLLVVSIVLMVIESALSAVLTPAKLSKQRTWQHFLRDERFYPNQISQTK
jgi:hypothetical protein